MPISPNFTTVTPLSVDPAFKTHLNYVTFLNEESHNLAFTVKANINTSIPENIEFDKKTRLVKFTVDNLNEEMKMINGLPDYAIVCSSWVSVKSYYLLFNLILILDYLLSGQIRTLKSTTHLRAQKIFKSHIKQSIISFSIDIFNEIHKCPNIQAWKFITGQNLSNTPSTDRHKQIIKKLCEYSKDEYKRQRNLSSLRGSLKIEFERSTEINLIDFFYWYRIKANYRDLEYLNVDISTSEFYRYYNNYYLLIMNIYQAFKPEINRIATIRLGRTILQ